MTNILITSAGRRVELVESFQREAAAAGAGIAIHASDLRPELSSACRIADAAVQMPRVTEPDYAGVLLDYCKANDVSAIVPTIDTELMVLAANRAAFEREGVFAVVSDEALIRQCRDKRLTAGLFATIGLDAPAVLAPDALRFPCFVKPIDGSSSIGARKLEGPGDVTGDELSDSRMLFLDFVDGSFVEYTIDCYFDRGGALQCWVPRERLETRAGEVSKGVTRRNFVHYQLAAILPRLKGARGCITLQVFAREADEAMLGIEINPRFGGGYPLSYAAGANFPKMLIDDYVLGRRLGDAPEWEADLLMLRYDAKVLVRDFD